jgi:class I fructose-bisphosphate aldolase
MLTTDEVKDVISLDDIAAQLGPDADSLLGHTCQAVSKDQLHLPGPDSIDRVFINSDRSAAVLKSLGQLFGHGRLANTGYLSLLPVDQGIEHSAGASFAPNPIYFDPENILKLAIEAGCNGVATTYGTLAIVARKYAHKIPLILKFNHNQILSYPNQADQISYSSMEQAFELGCVAVGATIYFGAPESNRQIQEVTDAFARAHELGMATILWCYLRNPAFNVDGEDYHSSADLTGQANHLGVTIGADIVKQKIATNNGGYLAMKKAHGTFGKYDDRMYDELCTDHPIDLCRYQVLNGYGGRIGLINSGGESGDNDLAQVVKTAVINKRAGGTGLISGRKTFQKPMAEGVKLFHAIQNVYLNDGVTIA